MGSGVKATAGAIIEEQRCPITNKFANIITSGRWFEAGDENVIVLSGKTAEKNNIEVSDIVNLNLGKLGTLEWEVVGTYRVV